MADEEQINTNRGGDDGSNNTGAEANRTHYRNQRTLQVINTNTDEFDPFIDSRNGRGEEIPVTVEEPWSVEIEQWLCIRLSDAKESSKLHAKAGYRLKFKHRLLGFLVIFLSTLVFIANSLLSCTNQLSNRVIMVLISGLNVFFSTLYSQLNMGQMSELHFQFEAKFVELAEDIEYELARDKDFRMPADAFMMMIKERVKRLTAAPEYPKGRYFFC